MTSRASVLASACLVAAAIVAGSAACSSTLNLGSPGDGGDPNAFDSAPPTCGSTCERIISTCHLVSSDKLFTCLAECKAQGRAVDLQCVANTPCGQIATTCGNGTIGEEDGSTFGPDPNVIDPYEIMICQNACDTALGSDCLNVSEHAACRTQCATASSDKRNSYASCQESSFGNCPKSHDCFTLFVKD